MFDEVQYSIDGILMRYKILIICLLVVSGRIPRQQCQTGPGGLPEWLADLAPKEPRVRRARGGWWGMFQDFSPGIPEGES